MFKTIIAAAAALTMLGSAPVAAQYADRGDRVEGTRHSTTTTHRRHHATSYGERGYGHSHRRHHRHVGRHGYNHSHATHHRRYR